MIKFLTKSVVFLCTIFMVIISGMITSCEEDKDVANTINETIVFEGITVTDNNGWVIENDPDDWTLAENWSDKENSLFVGKNVSACDNANSEYLIHPAFLNPCINQFNLGFTKPANSRFAFRIVDRNYNVLLSQDSVFSNGIAINVQDFNITNDTVRLYYKFFGLDCELKGHGDIKIN